MLKASRSLELSSYSFVNCHITFYEASLLPITNATQLFKYFSCNLFILVFKAFTINSLILQSVQGFITGTFSKLNARYLLTPRTKITRIQHRILLFSGNSNPHLPWILFLLCSKGEKIIRHSTSVFLGQIFLRPFTNSEPSTV